MHPCLRLFESQHTIIWARGEVMLGHWVSRAVPAFGGFYLQPEGRVGTCMVESTAEHHHLTQHSPLRVYIKHHLRVENINLREPASCSFCQPKGCLACRSQAGCGVGTCSPMDLGESLLIDTATASTHPDVQQARYKTNTALSQSSCHMLPPQQRFIFSSLWGGVCYPLAASLLSLIY